MTVQPLAGDFGLTDISGPLGWGIWLGQAATGDLASTEHAFLVVDDHGTTVEAMPSGARYNHVGAYGRIVWVRPPMDEDTRWRVATEGKVLANLRTRYSFAQYPALALLGAAEQLARLTGRPRRELRPAWLRRYIADSGRVICSQLVDEAYHRAGVRLFDDGRTPGDVSPGDLWRLGQRSGWILG